MKILGINAYHGDASAALLIDGELVSAVEEERFNRVKHWAGFPSLSIGYCLQDAGLSVEDVDHVAISFDHGRILPADWRLSHRTVQARVPSWIG